MLAATVSVKPFAIPGMPSILAAPMSTISLPRSSIICLIFCISGSISFGIPSSFIFAKSFSSSTSLKTFLVSPVILLRMVFANLPLVSKEKIFSINFSLSGSGVPSIVFLNLPDL